MAIQIKHAFQSLKGDGGDATLVRPSAWNADHATSINTGNVVGRRTAGVGAFEEIPLTAAGAAVLAASDASPYGFTTGDIKATFKTTADTGWIFLTGTIGNGSSGATQRANADVLALWTVLYNIADGYAPVSGGRTGNAVNDFNAGKTMNLSVLGNGRTLVNAFGVYALGQLLGASTVQLQQVHLPAVGLSVSVSGSVSGSVLANRGDIAFGGQTYFAQGGGAPIPISTGSLGGLQSDGSMSGGMSGGTSAMGSNVAHENMQPSIATNMMIKL